MRSKVKHTGDLDFSVKWFRQKHEKKLLKVVKKKKPTFILNVTNTLAKMILNPFGNVVMNRDKRKHERGLRINLQK